MLGQQGTRSNSRFHHLIGDTWEATGANSRACAILSRLLLAIGLDNRIGGKLKGKE